MLVPGCGFFLNDSLRDFGGGLNRPKPGKRPKSGMSPCLVFTEAHAPAAIVGAAGGNRIPGIVFTILARMLDIGQDGRTAVRAPRFVNENRTKTRGATQTRVEPAGTFGLSASAIEILRARGQKILHNSLTFGAAQLLDLRADPNRPQKGTDPRRNGAF